MADLQDIIHFLDEELKIATFKLKMAAK